MYRFFVEPHQITEEIITIAGDDQNHIVNVLRLKPNEKIIICDRQETDYCCIIKEIQSEGVCCRILSSYPSSQELDTKLYLFQGLPKQDKMEYIIQKSIELGIHEIIPVEMKRSIVKLTGDGEKKKQERWQKIAEAAAKQSHRALVPKVNVPMSLSKAIEYAKALDTIIVPYESAIDANYGQDVILNPKKFETIGIFVGPEGGFDSTEIQSLQEMGADIITLGNRILRTETASLVVLSNIMYNLEV